MTRLFRVSDQWLLEGQRTTIDFELHSEVRGADAIDPTGKRVMA